MSLRAQAQPDMKGNIIYNGAASGLVIEDNAKGVFTMNLIVGHEQVMGREAM